MKGLGLHLLRDVRGASSPLLGDAGAMSEFVRGAARDGGGVYASVHHAVDEGVAAVDVFSWAGHGDARGVMAVILGELGGRVVGGHDIVRFRETGVRETGESRGEVDVSTRGGGVGAKSPGRGSIPVIDPSSSMREVAEEIRGAGSGSTGLHPGEPLPGFNCGGEVVGLGNSKVDPDADTKVIEKGAE